MFCLYSIFFFNDTATTEIYTLSLHDALPICFLSLSRAGARKPRRRSLRRVRTGLRPVRDAHRRAAVQGRHTAVDRVQARDRKSTRLNSSHANISYAVFCLKKKKITYTNMSQR